MRDRNTRQNVATFCQTFDEPKLYRLMDDCIDKKMVDKVEYPQTAEIKARSVRKLAGLAMKRRWEARQHAAEKPTGKPNIINGPVQNCWHNFTRYWDIEHREIPMEDGRLLMTPEEVIARCDENTIGVVPTLGVTFTGEYEPFKAMSDALDTFQVDKGLDIPIHVDGARGWFRAPFCPPDLERGFRLPRARSINTSGHKIGLAPLGVGWVIWRSAADLRDGMVFYVNYLGGNMRDNALNFSRPGGQIVCQYYNFLRLRRSGYADDHTACDETAQFLTEEIAKIGPFNILYGGASDKGIPCVCWTMQTEMDQRFSLFDLAKRLRARGREVPAYTLPANQQETAIQRILVRNGVSRDLASLLPDHMRDALAHMDKNPTKIPLANDDASGFHH
ncbi:glutamate decarboxylase [Tateyamaria pelophila]|uniref:glutamate decarboxylase n=1 Tax=Tateyamaria pelophila TaxID=328415 RepID=UPI00295885CC|nr:glutamate decarboxylase [Tateyamaria pelophila]